MKSPPKWKRFWLCCRWALRSCRILFLAGLLALLIVFIWFNQVSLPDFLKPMVQQELKSRGLDVKFQRMYWKWFQGIVTEDLSIAPAPGKIGPTITIQSADVDLDLDALRKFEFKIKSIELFQGSGHWRVTSTNGEPRVLDVREMGTRIRFLPDDQWELSRFHANVQGIQIEASGIITNASLTRLQSAPSARKDKKEPGGEKRNRVEKWERQIYLGLQQLEKLRFAAPPQITLTLNADARERGELEARLTGTARALASPYGRCGEFSLTGTVTRSAETNAPAKASFTIQAANLQTEKHQARQATFFTFATLNPGGDWNALWNLGLRNPSFGWGEAEHLRIQGNASCDLLNTNHLHGDVAVEFTRLSTADVRSENLQISAALEGFINERRIENARLKGRVTGFDSKWARADHASFEATLTTNKTAVVGPAEWAGTIWRHLLPWRGNFQLHAEQVRDDQSHLNDLDVALTWDNPRLRLESLTARFPDGQLALHGELDATNRVFSWQSSSSFSPHQIAHLLGPRNVRYLSQYQFESPPVIETRGQLRFPAWTNRAVKWKTDIEPSLELAARITARKGSYRGVQYNAAETDLTITNQLLHLPNLEVERPEGIVRLSYKSGLNSRDYQFGVRSLADPRLAIPLLQGEPERKALKEFGFGTEMPLLAGELWGHWGDVSKTGVRARLNLTNFTFRGEQFERVSGFVEVTNNGIRVSDVFVKRAEGTLTTPGVFIDTAIDRVWLTNLVSTIDHMAICRIIGPKTARSVAPYRFSIPPKILLHGSVDTGRRAEKTTDLHFQVEGGAFSWFKFNLPHLKTDMHWTTNHLLMTNLVASAYGGSVNGALHFDFSPPKGNDFFYQLWFTNIGLRGLIADVSNPKNHLEGELSGLLNVTHGNTEFWNSWQGHGHARMTNGLLWDIPVFGLFSPILNTLESGLGNSKAVEATSTYIITNSVIYTRDMMIHSPPARLYYNGTVDFDANINARVEAKLFKNKFLVGQLFDLLTLPITKAFEYKVSGTLAQPKREPLFIAKVFLLPFKPLKALQEIFAGDGLRQVPKGQEKPKEK